MIWNKSKMTTLYYDTDVADENYPCVVRISDSSIVVEYQDDGVVQYQGKDNGTGHFELISDSVNGRATLHMFPGSSRLEGSWVEDGARGMWRIELA